MMVSQMGFSKKLGQVAWSSQGGNSFLGAQMAQPSDCSGDTQDAIDAEVKDIVDRAYRRAKDLVQSNIAVLHKTADLLMEREQIDGEDLQVGGWGGGGLCGGGGAGPGIVGSTCGVSRGTGCLLRSCSSRRKL
jgi:hypothetical protein